ncbi:ABC transporter substrate-binding protein [Vitiosangium sp. GDMCC 1.1324]|uniref:ABC transporter substrate-binding protein n=1 Tax=Vitiosangium sp. (strain GDMCC 1.1324) TaxID=2138576 RepID=UPI000D36F1A9|nr:ABC transporter substrate-binding protein [Vitiosangium sp. GDMCC 1.1324]PTL85500.1 hypothetical protein DAT35_01915 [Vitiosangium sp. GDMCC 1.1324]
MSLDDNVEWQLADLVDALSAEVDRAEDTLALKSYARKVSFAIKKMALDVEVTMRRAPDGRLFFRTVDLGQTSDTLLKLDFAQVLENQLTGMRKPLDDSTSSAPVSVLPGITPEEVRALNSIAIFTVDDFTRYTQTTAMVAEVGRKTGIAETRLRNWRGMPFMTALKPARGAPGSTVVLEGGNFGLVSPEGTVVLFNGHPAKVLSWSNARVTVEAPAEALGSGLVFAILGAQPTNVLAWEGTTVDLRVEDVTPNTDGPVADEPLRLEAALVNLGSAATQPFTVQWFLDDAPLAKLPHGPLQPGQRSTESGTQQELLLKPGTHTLRFLADANEELPGVDRAMLSFTRKVEVRAPQSLAMGDFRKLELLDPVRAGPVDGSSVLGLVFRGLGRRGPKGDVVPDLAVGWTAPMPVERGGVMLYSVTVTLRPEARFHDGSPVTAEDVRFSLQRMQQPGSPWSTRALHIREMSVSGSQVTLLLDAPDALAPLLPAGIVPRLAYEPDPDGFGKRPVGSGPFQVASFAPTQLELRAFRGYFRGAPRLDRLSVVVIPDLDRLGERVEQQELQMAVMPYDDAWFERLRDLGEWNLVRAATSTEGLLHVQVTRLLERNPAEPDVNAGAHLWYLKP